MQISPIGLIQSLTGLIGGRGDTTADAASAASARSSAAPPPLPTKSLREILESYDVRRIAPRDFSQFLKDLHAAGEISAPELKELALIRLELDKSGAAPSAPLDLVEFIRDRLWQAKQDPAAAGDSSDLAAQLEWLERFDAIHSDGSAFGVDQVA